MLSNQAIVCFSPDQSWHSIWRNRHQLMTRLARRNKILFVEPAPYLRPVLATLRSRGPRALSRGDIYSPIPNLWVYRSPDYFPIAGKKPIRQLTFALRKWHLQRVLARLDMQHPILWVFRYDLGEMIGHLHERLVIYHAVDEYAAYALPDAHNAEQHRQRIRQIERSVLRRSDLAFVSSARLLTAKRPYNENTYFVPNGVDYEHFSTPSLQPPPDIATLPPGPRLGYVGAINEKLDLVLLSAVARQHSDWQLLLVGPNLFKNPATLDPLLALENVHWFGPKPVAELPAYMHACDVCLMPYAHNAWTEHINPLKLYEYLATGRPIVSTDIPAVQDFREVLAIADNESAFVAAIDRALRQDTPAAAARRQAIARQNTWEQRVATLSSIIQGHLSGR